MFRIFFLVLSFCLFLVLNASAEIYSSHSILDCSKISMNYREWCEIKNKRRIEINLYHQNHKDSSEALLFKANGTGQIPYIFFRIYPELFHEIWGQNLEPFDKIGLAQNPFSNDQNLPMGLASGPVTEKYLALADEFKTLNKVTFSCTACHSGEVKINAHEKINIIGAPSTRINNLWFAFARTAQLPNFNAETIRKTISEKPLGWFYQSDKLKDLEKNELDLLLKPQVIEEIVQKFKLKAQTQLQAFDYVAQFSAANPDVLSPLLDRRGSLDGLIPSFLAFLRFNPSNKELHQLAFPKESAEVDSPSIWMQRNKGYKHWDGTQGVDLHRNIGAARANLNETVDIENVNKITEFIKDLPADPYPFNVDMKLARLGEKHFQNYCLRCHTGENKVFSQESVGTDLNRIKHFPKIMADFQGQILKSLCLNPQFCLKPNGSEYSTPELAREAKGYVAASLEGLWARAPYLHNGSVPTLRALLTNNRPAQFYRGDLTYDEANVGFNSMTKSPNNVVYDTKFSGQSNSGHNSIEYLGQDWNTKPNELNELLEYLKTL